MEKYQRNFIPAYDKMYLDGTMDLIRLVFIMFNENNTFNIFDQIDSFMRTSEIRKLMDVGNWSALMKGSKQVYNSVDFSICANDNVKSDGIMLHWLADVYTYWQWKYNIPSAEISNRCDARMLEQLYYPFHELSVSGACDRLHNRFIVS